MDMKQLAVRMAGNAKTIDSLMGALEAIALAVVGRVASWVAAVPCAVMTARASAQFFELSWPIAVAVAVALELVGQTTSNLWLNAKEWNGNRRRTDPAANERLAFVLMVGYFAADFLIIAALEVPDFLATRNAQGLTALLFPLLSVVGVMALNERVAQYKREADVAMERQERTEKRKPARKQGTAKAEPQVEGYAQVATSTRERALTILTERPGITGSELGRELGRSERLGRKLKTELLPEVGGNGSGSDRILERR